MTWICYRGIELSARVQTVLLSFEIVTLALFVVVALIKVYTSHPVNSIHVSASWFNPFDMGWGALIDAVLLGIFIYWGWDSGVAVNEESRDSRRGPGKAAIVSTVILLLIYVLVTAAAQADHGTGYLSSSTNQSDVLNALGTTVFGSPLNKLLIIAVLTSASASTQTTILPTARTTLSMAKWNAIPAAFGRIHPRFLTPTFSTVLMGGLSIVWTVALLAFNPNQNVLGDTISALGFAVCFYYGCTGHRVRRSTSARSCSRACATSCSPGCSRSSAALALFGIAIKAYSYYSTAGNNYSKPIIGIQTPILVGIGGLILGVILMFASWPFFIGILPPPLVGECRSEHAVPGRGRGDRPRGLPVWIAWEG